VALIRAMIVRFWLVDAFEINLENYPYAIITLADEAYCFIAALQFKIAQNV